MKRFALTAIGICSMYFVCFAQLTKLCPISSTVLNSEKLRGVNLLLTTKDFVPVLVPGGKTTRTSTVQLVNAMHPFPPLWYQIGDIKTDSGGNFMGTTFLLDAQIQDKGGRLTFFGSYPGAFFGAVTLDTATLKIVDTLSKYNTYTNDVVMENIDLHDFQTDKDGNKLFANQVQRKINATCLSGLSKDSVRTAVVNDIIILNSKDSIIFKWNPLEHLSACEMNWEYRDASLSYGDMINWSHVNSVRFANDGNIIYSFRHIGMGKINRKTGAIMWKLGGKDTLNSIRLPENAGSYLQHDFSQWKNGLYSVFSNGDSSHAYAEGIAYKIDEVNKKATFVNRYRPKPTLFSRALGSYECINNTCVIDFGMYKPFSSANSTQEMAHILVDNKLAAIISAPPMNFSYQVHATKWAAIQRRPKVSMKNNVLYSDEKKGLHDYIWYKIDSTTAIPVGAGLFFKPLVSGKYVVEAQQGSDRFKSYLISDVFVFTRKKE